MSTNELSPEQLQRWAQAQQGETQFWQDWMHVSSDLGDTKWLQYVLKYFELTDSQNFGTEALIDLGSGPVGILTRLQASYRIAIDPLPIDTIDNHILRIKRPGENTGLPSAIADRIFIYNLLQHVISPEHVLAECERLLKPGATAYLLEQLNLPTDLEHPHSLKLDMFDNWVRKHGFQIMKRTIQNDYILSSSSPARPGTGYMVLCLVVKKL